MAALSFILFIVIGYLCGSVCSAVIVSRLFSLPDPRLAGSRNPGATNVLRLSGKKYAAIVLLADMLKGLFPVVLAQIFNAEPITVSFTCLAAVLGHMYPVFFGFHGGKGVATAMGALVGLHFLFGVAVIATWLLVANFTRYASLASIISMALAPLYVLLIVGRLDVFPPIFFITLFILYQHRNNITRLIDKEEPKIQFSGTLNEEISSTLAEQAEEAQLEEEEEKEKEPSETLSPPVEKEANKK